MLVPDPGAFGGAKASLPGAMYVAAYCVVGALDDALDGHRNRLNDRPSTLALAGSLQSTLNVYTPTRLFCSTKGRSGISPLQRPWVPLVLPGAGTVPCT